MMLILLKMVHGYNQAYIFLPLNISEKDRKHSTAIGIETLSLKIANYCLPPFQ